MKRSRLVLFACLFLCMVSFPHVLVAGTASPGTAEELLEKAEALMGEKKFKEAIPLLDKALAKKPDFVQALRRRGTALTESGQLDRAMIDLQRGLILEPKNPRLHFCVGLIHVARKQAAEARACFSKAFELDPSYVSALENRGLMNEILKEFSAAISDFESVLKMDSKNFIAWKRIGVIKNGQRDLEGARQAFRKTLEIKPGDNFCTTTLASLEGGSPASPSSKAAPSTNPVKPASKGARIVRITWNPEMWKYYDGIRAAKPKYAWLATIHRLGTGAVKDRTKPYVLNPRWDQPGIPAPWPLPCAYLDISKGDMLQISTAWEKTDGPDKGKNVQIPAWFFAYTVHPRSEFERYPQTHRDDFAPEYLDGVAHKDLNIHPANGLRWQMAVGSYKTADRRTSHYQACHLFDFGEKQGFCVKIKVWLISGKSQDEVLPKEQHYLLEKFVAEAVTAIPDGEKNLGYPEP